MCIQPSADATYNGKSKRYQPGNLFGIPPVNETISFDEMLALPWITFNTPKYSNIHDTRPQDVPIKTTVEQIKAGSVMFSVLHYLGHTGGRSFDRDGNIVNLPGVAGDALEKYDGKSNILMDEINLEIDKYDDLILGDYEDKYFNLSWKTVANLC
ncbi:unnamed protein product [Hymenolepis diminuta]|uniref:Uncharacterized protein n=1 Tax=Hymenolepis diminuta TaxID=6216 RepID=A0A564YYV8_HYMDI|nr:unnamed protein product [Hymenolepis diminuta]